MSNIDSGLVELLKQALKELQSGVPLSVLREKYGSVLSRVSPVDVVLAEQKLLESGASIKDILQFCDFHVDLVKDYLADVSVKDMPPSHPLTLLVRENEEILRQAEAVLALALNASREADAEKRAGMVKQLESMVKRLRASLRVHYRKNQMLLFPYLERAGIIAPPRVLWSREDNVIRGLWDLEAKLRETPPSEVSKLVDAVSSLTREISELVLRENRILYPTMKVILRDPEWKAVHLEAKRLGYLVQAAEDWDPGVEPVYPYQFARELRGDEIEKLPEELRAFAMSANPDKYEIRREGDLELETGFARIEELEGVLRGLPLELTFADANGRIRFFTESEIAGGFPRTKTIVGRNFLFCHPPRLEKYVQLNADLLKSGKEKYREFWTKLGNRVIRVIIVGVRDKQGNYLGTLEVVEDMTDVLLNAKEILEKRITVL